MSRRENDRSRTLGDPADLAGEATLGALADLAGEATLGDLMSAIGRDREALEADLEALLRSGRVQVRVTEPGQVVYRLESRQVLRRSPRPSADPTPSARFDRKTLHLIHARRGVVSVAELVEHTGTTVSEAEREMRRLVDAYQGEAHPSLDGHVVYAFPALMTRLRDGVGLREPRPAWSRLHDPMASRRLAEGTRLHRWAYARGLLSWGRRLVRLVGPLRRIRLRRPDALRRLTLGHVFETALAGRGVVSVDTTRRYLDRRIGGRPIRPSRVEAVLKGLSAEFEAPITREGGTLFFGFRSVKRQFLAAEIVRRRLALGDVVSGATVFDSGDSRAAANARELELFDRELGRGALRAVIRTEDDPKVHP